MSTAFEPSTIPQQLRALPRWVVWREVRVEGRPKPTKVPVDPSTGHKLNWSDSKNWTDFDTAVRRALEKGLGVGFVINQGDQLCCIDFDHDDTPSVREFQRNVLEHVDGAYVETSPSGKGLHVWVKLDALSTHEKAIKGVEVYTHKRFMTVTGLNAKGEVKPAPAALIAQLAPYFASDAARVSSVSTIPLCPDDEVLKLAHDAYGKRFDELWEGKWEELGHPSQSEGDLEFCCMLARFTSDLEQFGRLFRASGLGQREKASRPDYLRRTFTNARQEVGAIEHGESVAKAIIASDEARKKKKANGRRVLSFDEFKSYRPDTAGDIIEGLLSPGSQSVVYGDSGTSKTFLSLYLSTAVGLGIPFFGRRTKRVPVVYLVGEGKAKFWKRLSALRSVVTATPDIGFYPWTLDAPNAKGIEEILRVLRETEEMYGAPPGLLVFDTLNRFFGDGNESATDDMTRYVNASYKLIETYPALHVQHIHHAGKDPSKGMRGSGTLRAAVDTVLECKKDGNACQARVDKSRDGEDGITFDYRLRVVEVGRKEDGTPETSCVVEPQGQLKVGPPASTALSPQDREVVGILLAHSDGTGREYAVDYNQCLADYRKLHPSKSPDTNLKAVKRALEALTRGGLVVWQPKQPMVLVKPALFTIQEP